MVFIKVKPCSTRPAFPPAVPPPASPSPFFSFLSLPPFSHPFFFSFFSFLSSLLFYAAFATVAKESVKPVRRRNLLETPLSQGKNEKGRTRSWFDVINLGMAVTRSDGRGSSSRNRWIEGTRRRDFQSSFFTVERFSPMYH